MLHGWAFVPLFLFFFGTFFFFLLSPLSALSARPPPKKIFFFFFSSPPFFCHPLRLLHHEPLSAISLLLSIFSFSFFVARFSYLAIELRECTIFFFFFFFFFFLLLFS